MKRSEEAQGAKETAWDPEMIEVAEEFLQECDEGLARVDALLLDIEENGPAAEKTHALFRVYHSIKGVAGFLELAEIAQLAHATESLLSRARETSLDGRSTDLLFDANRAMGELVKGLRRAVAAGKRPSSSGTGIDVLVRRLRDALNEPLETPDEPEAVSPLPEDAPPSRSLVPLPSSDGKKHGREDGAAREVVRVDLQRVDALIELVGELVIVESMIAHAPEKLGTVDTSMRKHLSQMAKITRDLQDIGTRMRMVPLRALFQKMARMVRDLSRNTGKTVRTVFEGEGTEIDRSMVEQISDPLVHMIRNAIDHGIESPAQREAAGKAREGTITLRACHSGGSVVIEIADDGRGLDAEAILRKAREKGIVAAHVSLAEEEAYSLIFAPGFSTAERVSELSGRGVGMDVVKRSVEALRGKVRVSSRPGRGATITLTLPLTLSIIDGMLVVCGGERYIVPSLSVVELLRPEEGAIFELAGRVELVRVRDKVMPLLRLGRLLDIPSALENPTEGLVVVIEAQGRQIGLLVDEVSAQQQVVIKGLGWELGRVPHLAGSAVLSDGQVGLILNPDEIGGLAGPLPVAFSNRSATTSGAQVSEQGGNP